MSFKDHFSTQSADYAKYRPRYPKALYDFLLAHAKEKKIAWDVATGNGQVAIELAEHFEKVIATDASESQISHATSHPKVIYKVSMAENSGLPDGIADLITVGQALHWFDFEKFFSEAKRAAKPGCFFAAWGYKLHNITPEVDKVTTRFYEEIVGHYWPRERTFVDYSYNNIQFPFQPIETPLFHLHWRWNMNELLGYLSTWSSTQLYIKYKGTNPLELIEDDLQQAWGNPLEELEVVWPIFMKAGYL